MNQYRLHMLFCMSKMTYYILHDKKYNESKLPFSFHLFLFSLSNFSTSTYFISVSCQGNISNFQVFHLILMHLRFCDCLTESRWVFQVVNSVRQVCTSFLTAWRPQMRAGWVWGTRTPSGIKSCSTTGIWPTTMPSRSSKEQQSVKWSLWGWERG